MNHIGMAGKLRLLSLLMILLLKVALSFGFKGYVKKFFQFELSEEFWLSKANNLKVMLENGRM